MLFQRQQTNSVIQHMDKSAQLEHKVFQNILNSVDTGIALIDKKYTLLYCNPVFNKLLDIEVQPSLGEKVVLGSGLKLSQLRDIHTQLEENEFWQGIFPELGKGLKLVISKINFPIPTFITSLSEAHYMLLVTDHSDMLEQQQELTNAKHLAAKSEKEKAELLSQMSHEMRTPLNAIQGFTQLLQIEPTLSDEQKEYLGEIMSASKYLLKLTNEILSLSKTNHEYGELKLSNEPIDIDELVAECISLVKPLAQKANIQLIQRESSTTIVKDRVRLKQIVVNLLSNAVKYNHEAGQVVIQSFAVSDSKIRIEIQDSGKGIPTQQLSTIFNPFERLGVKNSQIEGSGIGLMITRRLVSLMNGTISVLSETGKGSIFSLEFPTESTAICNGAPFLFEQPRKIFWVGNDSSAQQFAKRLTSLRPAMEFLHVKDVAEASHLALKSKADLIFLNIKDSLHLLDNPSPEIENLLKNSSTIAVIGGNLYPEIQLGTNLKFAGYLSMAFTAIDFMKIIDTSLNLSPIDIVMNTDDSKYIQYS